MATLASDPLIAAVPSRSRQIALLAATIWVAILAMGVAILWAGFGTGFLEVAASAGGVVFTPEQTAVVHAAFLAIVAISVGYATVGALLAGRVGAARIATVLLAGGFLFALVPFGYAVGGTLGVYQPPSTLIDVVQMLGPVAVGPAYATILPGLALTFPDGGLPSRRWRIPVGAAVTLVLVGTLLALVQPAALMDAPGGARPNPFGVDAIPTSIGALAFPLAAIGVLCLTVLGVAAVFVRYRRGDAVLRQQMRWFLAAVTIAAIPLALTVAPPTSGPQAGLVSAIGLMLLPIAVGIAVTRYRLYQIDHLISRTLVYVPLTALLAGLYAATVTLLQRLFQSVTGDRSDAAIIISTLILASVFTPLRKWLEGIVERRFKPAASTDVSPMPASWEARVAAIALGVVRTEIANHAADGPEPW